MQYFHPHQATLPILSESEHLDCAPSTPRNSGHPWTRLTPLCCRARALSNDGNGSTRASLGRERSNPPRDDRFWVLLGCFHGSLAGHLHFLSNRDAEGTVGKRVSGRTTSCTMPPGPFMQQFLLHSRIDPFFGHNRDFFWAPLSLPPRQRRLQNVRKQPQTMRTRQVDNYAQLWKLSGVEMRRDVAHLSDS